jgi:hypothetical protein
MFILMQIRMFRRLQLGKRKEKETNIQIYNSLRTWVTSKSEGIDRYSDNKADGDVEVAYDDFNMGKNCVVTSESKRIVCVCHGGNR